MGLKVLSLFDGISCGMVALERAGFEVDRYVAYEIEESAIKISNYNYPQIEHKGDVFKAEYKENEFDLLIGGSPCTYWSIARCPYVEDKRETISSGLGWELFMQYVRALKESNVRWFIYENNSSISKEIQSEISKQLGVNPIEINSGCFSAQDRKRLYWTNIPFDMQIDQCGLVFGDIEYSHDYKMRDFVKYWNTMRVSKDGNVYSWDTSGKGNYSQQNRARVKTCKMNTLPSSGDDKNNVYLGGYFYRKIHPIEAERLQTLPDDYTSCLKSDVKRVEVCGNGWTVDVIAHIFSFMELPGPSEQN